MAKINERLRCLKCDETIFINPNFSANDFLTERVGQDLFSFESEGVSFLITNNKLKVKGLTSFQDIFIKVNESLWAKSRIDIFEWELVYLVNGFEAVNNLNYFRDCSIRSSDKDYFLSSVEVKEEIDVWAKKGDDDMVKYLKSQYRPVVMNSDGCWMNVASLN